MAEKILTEPIDVIEVNNLSINYYSFPNNLKEVLTRLLKRKKILKTTNVLENITFKLKKGEIICLGGSNGSGKSTLLYAICDKIEPVSGYVKVNEKLAAYFPGGTEVEPTEVGINLLISMAYLHGYNKKDVLSKIETISSFSGLPKSTILTKPLYTYSTGMLGRLKSTFYLLFSNEISIYDELFVGGDSDFITFWFTQFEKKLKEGTSSIIVSHSMHVWEKLHELGSKFIIIANKTIAYQGYNILDARGVYENSIKFKSR